MKNKKVFLYNLFVISLFYHKITVMNFFLIKVFNISSKMFEIIILSHYKLINKGVCFIKIKKTLFILIKILI